MRTFTEVGEGTLCVGRNATILKVLLDVLNLIGLSLCRELLYGVSLRYFAAYYSLIITCQFKHLVFYLLEVALLNHLPIWKKNIVEETILYGRTETELYAGKQLLQGFGKKVSRSVPEGMLTLFVFKAIEVYLCVLIDRTV